MIIILQAPGIPGFAHRLELGDGKQQYLDISGNVQHMGKQEQHTNPQNSNKETH